MTNFIIGYNVINIKYDNLDSFTEAKENRNTNILSYKMEENFLTD